MIGSLVTPAIGQATSLYQTRGGSHDFPLLLCTAVPAGATLERSSICRSAGVAMIDFDGAGNL